MKTRTSIQTWSIYEFAVGLSLVFVPVQFMAIFGIAATEEVWVRVIGVLAISLGYYYWVAARNEAVGFYRASVAGRLIVALLYVFLGAVHGPWQLFIFAAAALAGSVWTQMTMAKSTQT